MLAVERRSMILNQLKNDKVVLVSDMSAQFGVSEETIRRDMEKLEQEGYATRTYGGAVYNEDSRELPYEVRKRTNVAAKEKIAHEVAKMIKDGDYIMLDDSTTSMYVARKLKSRRNITLITNSIEIILELSGSVQDWNIHCTGGLLKPYALAFMGHRAESVVRAYHVNYAILSCEGLDLDEGYTDSREENSMMKRAMMASARQVILVADSDKFGKISFASTGKLSELDVLVTDVNPGEQWKESLDQNDVKLIIAE